MAVLQEIKKARVHHPKFVYIDAEDYKELIAEADNETVEEIIRSHSIYGMKICPYEKAAVFVDIEFD